MHLLRNGSILLHRAILKSRYCHDFINPIFHAFVRKTEMARISGEYPLWLFNRLRFKVDRTDSSALFPPHTPRAPVAATEDCAWALDLRAARDIPSGQRGIFGKPIFQVKSFVSWLFHADKIKPKRLFFKNKISPNVYSLMESFWGIQIKRFLFSIKSWFLMWTFSLVCDCWKTHSCRNVLYISVAKYCQKISWTRKGWRRLMPLSVTQIEPQPTSSLSHCLRSQRISREAQPLWSYSNSIIHVDPEFFANIHSTSWFVKLRPWNQQAILPPPWCVGFRPWSEEAQKRLPVIKAIRIMYLITCRVSVNTEMDMTKFSSQMHDAALRSAEKSLGKLQLVNKDRMKQETNAIMHFREIILFWP